MLSVHGRSLFPHTTWGAVVDPTYDEARQVLHLNAVAPRHFARESNQSNGRLSFRQVTRSALQGTALPMRCTTQAQPAS